MSPLAARFKAQEDAWCLAANRWATRQAVRALFRVVSRLGDGVFWYVLMATMAVGGGRAGLLAATHMALVGVVAALLYSRLKSWTRRPRPCAADARIRAWVAPLDEYSFPSGHTLHAVSFTIVALAHYPALAWLLLPFAAAVAASRVVLGVHYPSDVLAATGIGGLLGALALWLWPWAIQPTL